jgi:bis(5'-nucleosyl)-tetraphosphatase (symmetrical)
MAVYAIGDVQGCFHELLQLLGAVRFDAARDRLWFTGDLVNRGLQSVDVLRFVKSLGDRATVVLGNHDLHLLAVAAGVTHLRPKDSFMDVLEAYDRDSLLSWLRQRPLLHHDAGSDFTLIHAGLPPQWDLAAARGCAAEA